jgi:flagellar hook-associated protein 1
MSTFAGISTALSSLIAQRQALEVSSQNLANQNTVGYTRQRAAMSSVSGTNGASLQSVRFPVGQGVTISSVERLSDAFVDARLRSATSSSSYLTARSDAYSRLEDILGESTTSATTSLSGQLTTFWSSWQEASNDPSKSANGAVLLTQAQTVVDKLHSLSSGISGEWADTYSSASALVNQVNADAASIADLNNRIMALTSNGQSASELLDQRDTLVTTLSQRVGASAVNNEDGTIDVMVGGNALVNGTRVSTIALSGATTYNQAASGTSVILQWSDHPGVPMALTGGTVAGQLSELAPPASGGILTSAGAGLDTVAAQLISSVNALHTSAVTTSGAAGGTFFSGTNASDISVAVSSSADLALADPSVGGYDGSIGLEVSRLGTTSGGPDDLWSQLVVSTGAATSAAQSSASVAEASRSAIEGEQLAGRSVDADEETVGLLTYQRAYQAAARMVTTIDEVLDTLINRMAV